MLYGGQQSRQRGVPAPPPLRAASAAHEPAPQRARPQIAACPVGVADPFAAPRGRVALLGRSDGIPPPPPPPTCAKRNPSPSPPSGFHLKFPRPPCHSPPHPYRPICALISFQSLLHRSQLSLVCLQQYFI